MAIRADRVAVVTFWDPWEAPHGGTLRTRAFCEAFADLGSEVTCIYPASSTSTPGTIDGVIRVPVAGQTVGHRRWPAAAQRLKRWLLPMPTATGARSPALEAALQQRGRLDLVIVSHLAAVRYGDVVPTARLWLDQSDLWSRFAVREVAQRRGPARLTAARQLRGIVREEERAAGQASVVTAAGWSDASALQDRSGATVHWLPTAVPAASDEPSARRRTDRPTLGYLANFAYHPNVDALQLLTDGWLPVLRERGWRLLVAGLGSERVNVPDDVEVMGEVAALDDFYDAVDATAAPIRLGGGMKVKVIESLLKGRPVVATAFAVDGFPPEIRSHAVVVDVDSPDIPPLGALRPVQLPAGVRGHFSPAGFKSVVADALADAD